MTNQIYQFNDNDFSLEICTENISIRGNIETLFEEIDFNCEFIFHENVNIEKFIELMDLNFLMMENENDDFYSFQINESTFIDIWKSNNSLNINIAD